MIRVLIVDDTGGGCLQRLQGDWQRRCSAGGLANIASMGMSGLSNELKVVNAIKQGNVGDALSSLGQMVLPGVLGETKIGDFTLSDIAKGASDRIEHQFG